MLVLRRLLVPTDRGPCAAAAYAHARRLARLTDAELHLVHAETVTDEVQDDPAVTLPPPDGLRLVEATVTGDTVAGALLNYAEQHGMDLIVAGTHGRTGLAHWLLGSVAERLVREAPCPVLTVRACDEPAAPPPIRRILAPVDFSARSEHALRHARALADLYDARVDLLHVVAATLAPEAYGLGLVWDEAIPEVLVRSREALAEVAARLLGDARTGALTVEVGSPADVVLSATEAEPIDLVVMATHGLTGFRRFALGSVTERVVQHAACPVFTVKSLGRSLVTDA